MSRILVLFAAFTLCTATAGPAFSDGATAVNEPARWALGARLGGPTGLTAKRYLGGRGAFDINLDVVYGPGFRVGADYLWGLLQARPGDALNLDFYLGVGAFVGALSGPCQAFGTWRDNGCDGSFYAGGCVPLGLEAVFTQVPLSLGLELAPGLAIAPGRAGFLLDADLIVRVLL